ncbi:AAA family ATPase [Desertibacillus haloalkaliphilus]|uniref:AAA family ATPase n=1 Tax=Desertibacillus haloalkaliphilus TaxID=1328930 RepID=UPI001C2811F1|nr:AAA family ATPase [Desertibacillus haloalkaliphilus]MBU8908038.1 AAA family ATPase [Desertibacillus haloalkaliphilus]
MKMRWLALADSENKLNEIKIVARRHGKVLKHFSVERNLKKNIQANQGTIIFLYESTTYDIYELCGELSFAYPLVTIILIASKEEIDLKKAMYVGAVDALETPLQEEDITQAVKKAESIIEFKTENTTQVKEKERSPAQVLTVCSTKGGVGKTTIAVNLAVSLAKQKNKVAIIDLDLQFGDVSISFDVQPKTTIYEWIKESYEVTEEKKVKPFMVTHKSGVDILSAPLLPEFAEVVNGEHVSFICEALMYEYDYIIFDTPPALVETVLVALEYSQEILLITAMDLPTLKNGKLAIETLALLGLKDRIKVVLNRDAEMEGMTIETVKNIMGIDVYSRIASDYKAVVSSLNKGEPLVLSQNKSAVAKGIVTLADKLTGKNDQPKKKPRLLRLFKK